MKIGFIGLGNMGNPMAANLIQAGYHLKVFDVNPDNMDPFAKLGAELSRSSKEIGEECNIIITMLPNAAAVESAIIGESGLIHCVQEGSIVMDMSSSSPISTKKIGSSLAAKGVCMVDAPVSGGVKGAREGTLSILLGGRQEDVAAVTPILQVLGQKLIHVGELGSGHTVKALNNLLTATTLLATSEAMVAGVKFGVDPNKMLEAINSSSGSSFSSLHKFPKILDRNFDVGFTIDLMYKDLGIAMEIADSVEVPTFLGSNVRHFWGFAVGQGGGRWDHTAIVKFVEKWAGIELNSNTD
ncbi:NAD(P)-dependent oxidoreductase [Effusibacillus dendaii]|uniref:2-hydroxy-3-oxopropionate reductase n=1 Tax=Effusibacillus dendaii TaxID=2743772 RepID=A0A7I8DBQ7_9BACL|nr:NAD(P)-dependent oxidoreductase [Effusibacillus dendaii]BCJ86399.1 2-hydroxy-3-oxopropionate reductase [Effusibacillus dendaii]